MEENPISLMYDSDGDTVIHVKTDPEPFAPESGNPFPEDALWRKYSRWSQTKALALEGEARLKKPKKKDSPALEYDDSVRVLVSSRHLILASTYFQMMFGGPWKESSRTNGKPHAISLTVCDQEAFLIILSIIHGRTRRVPETVSLELLSKIAVLVDYYRCHEAVEHFARSWGKGHSWVDRCNRDLVLQITITTVFAHTRDLRQLCKVAIRRARGPIPTLDLPIPWILTS